MQAPITPPHTAGPRLSAACDTIGSLATYLRNGASSTALFFGRNTMRHGFKIVEITALTKEEQAEARPFYAQTTLFVIGAIPYAISGYYGGLALGGKELGVIFGVLNGGMNGYQFATLPHKSWKAIGAAGLVAPFISQWALYLSRGVEKLDPKGLANFGAAIVAYFMASGVIKNTIGFAKLLKQLCEPSKSSELVIPLLPGQSEPDRITCIKALRKIAARLLAGGLGYPLAADNLVASQNPHNLFAIIPTHIYGEDFAFKRSGIQIAGSSAASAFAYGHIADDTLDYLFDADKRGPCNAPNTLSWIIGLSFIAASLTATAIGIVDSDAALGKMLMGFFFGFVGAFFTNFGSAKEIAESLLMGGSRLLHPYISRVEILEDTVFHPTAVTPMMETATLMNEVIVDEDEEEKAAAAK